MSLVTATTTFTTAIQTFVDDLSQVGFDVVPDVFELARAAIDVDGFLTDEELAAFIIGFEQIHPRLSEFTPGDLRRQEAFRGARRFLQEPSPIFESLVEADLASGTSNSWRYVDHAGELLRSLAALDGHVSHVELNSMDGFRATLTKRLGAAGLVRQKAASASGAVPTSNPEDVLTELDALVGLDDVKHRVRQLADLLRIRALRSSHDLPNPELSHHLAFVGNPGTGKTTVARLIGRLYSSLGLLDRGHVVEVDRASLVAGYVGQTAAKVDEIVESARGGVLVVDEAYSLSRGTDGYGVEAIDALVKRMEDLRGELVVVLTGYPDEMQELLDVNPGMRSRLARTIEFADYTDSELLRILSGMVRSARYELDPATRQELVERIDSVQRGRSFGNGRWVRNVFEQMLLEHASRLASTAHPTLEDLSILKPTDVPEPHWD